MKFGKLLVPTMWAAVLGMSNQGCTRKQNPEESGNLPSEMTPDPSPPPVDPQSPPPGNHGDIGSDSSPSSSP